MPGVVHLPKPYAVLTRGRREPSAIRAENGMLQGVAQLSQAGDVARLARLPDACCAIEAGGNHARSVRAEPGGLHRPGVSPEQGDPRPRGNIPNPDSGSNPREHPAAVRAE